MKRSWVRSTSEGERAHLNGEAAAAGRFADASLPAHKYPFERFLVEDVAQRRLQRSFLPRPLLHPAPLIH
jgi:hypothetical protein